MFSKRSDSDDSSGDRGDTVKGEDPKLDKHSDPVDENPESNQHTKSDPWGSFQTD